MSITRERLLEIIVTGPEASGAEQNELARMVLAAMDSESWRLPLDYLQGHKDGLEWAAQLAEANHPETGDWLYDDPIELAKAIRKGPDMPPAQPVADSEPVAYMTYKGYLLHAGDPKLAEYSEPMPLYADPRPEPTSAEPVAWLLSGGGTKNIVCFDSGNAYADPLREVTPLYRHAQPAPVVPEEMTPQQASRSYGGEVRGYRAGWNACRAVMLAAAPQSPGSEPATVPGKWIPVSERMPEVGDIVLTAMGGAVNVGETECSAANCRFFTSVISGRELPATHWMPLPAAPKEVKGE